MLGCALAAVLALKEPAGRAALAGAALEVFAAAQVGPGRQLAAGEGEVGAVATGALLELPGPDQRSHPVARFGQPLRLTGGGVARRRIVWRLWPRLGRFGGD